MNIKSSCLLIVDDNLRMRAFIRRVCAPHVAQCIEANNGLEAVAAYEEFQPDLVIMDFEMSAADGITATRRIRERHPEARIIIVTQHDSSAIQLAAIDEGATFLRKDDLLRLPQLLQAI